MTDLSQALAEINAIRAQVARGTLFRGYGPGTVAFSGILALAVAYCESLFRTDRHSAPEFLAVWVTTAAVCVILSTIDTVLRTRRLHPGFSAQMVESALEHFLPSTVAGGLLTGVFLVALPADLWMLPGLWEMVFSLGVFASCRFLPRRMYAVGVWYLGCGLACLLIQSGPRVLSPWEMGVPFGVGQLLVAAVLRYGFEDGSEER